MFWRASHRNNGERTGRDSNSRYRVHRYAGFRDRCLQPLGHLSNRPQVIRAPDLLQPDHTEPDAARVGMWFDGSSTVANRNSIEWGRPVSRSRWPWSRALD